MFCGRYPTAVRFRRLPRGAASRIKDLFFFLKAGRKIDAQWSASGAL
jgi:hypothetical protein